MAKRKLHTFEDVARAALPYFKEARIKLTFEGYQKTLQDYFRVQDVDFLTIYELITIMNHWSNYFSEILNITSLLLEDAITELDYQVGLLALYRKEKREDISIKEKILQEQKRKVNILKLFKKELEARQKFFTNAFFHLMGLYGRSQKAYEQR